MSDICVRVSFLGLWVTCEHWLPSNFACTPFGEIRYSDVESIKNENVSTETGKTGFLCWGSMRSGSSGEGCRWWGNGSGNLWGRAGVFCKASIEVFGEVGVVSE